MLKTNILELASFVTPLAIAAGLLTTPGQAQTDAGFKGCTNASLHGTYAFTIQGTLAVPGETLLNGAGLPIRGLARTSFDGNGNLTQVDHTVVNGMPPPLDWTPGTGTYSINADCTGTAVINSASNPGGPLNLHLIVTKLGNEVQQVVDVNAVTALGEKID